MLLYQDRSRATRLQECSRHAKAVQRSHPNRTRISGPGHSPFHPLGALRMPHGSVRAWESQTGLAKGLGLPRLRLIPLTLSPSPPCRSSPSLWFSCCRSAPPPTHTLPCPTGSPAPFEPGTRILPCPCKPGELTVGQASREQQQQEEPQECLHR